MGVGGMKKKIHPSRRSMMMKAIKGDSSSSLTWAMDDDDELSSSTFFVSSMTSMKRILLSNKKSTTTYTMKLSGQKDYERQTRRRRRKRSRSISFNENVQVHKVQPVSSLLLKEEDIQQIWYTNDEMNEIKRKYMALVYVQRKEYTDDERRQMPNYCIRGLEPLIHKKQRQERISVAMQCVLDGQHNDVDENNNNRLARAYKEVTNQSIIDAVRRGTSDSVLAASIHRRSNTTIRTKNT